MSTGDIIALAGVLLALALNWIGMEHRLTRIETKLDVLWERLPCLKILGKMRETSDSCNLS
jgi:hypothetical protein